MTVKTTTIKTGDELHLPNDAKVISVRNLTEQECNDRGGMHGWYQEITYSVPDRKAE